MPDPLAGKVTLITGATRGIGRSMVEELSRAGAEVVAVGRSRHALDSLAASSVKAVQCDVTKESDVEQLFAQLKGRRLDVLINNAGVAHEMKPVGELSIADWQRVIDTNLTATFNVTAHALKLMSRGALIINVISMAAATPFVNFSAYNASKAGALAFTNTLREELREKGIRVCALLPGATDTEIWQQFWPDAPRGNMVKPETIGRLVAHICKLPPEANIDQVTVNPVVGAL